MLFSAGDHWLIRSNTSSLGNIEVEGGGEGSFINYSELLTEQLHAFRFVQGINLPATIKKQKREERCHRFILFR
jgi:hypothetical protein